jgi:hypothetical protein
MGESDVLRRPQSLVPMSTRDRARAAERDRDRAQDGLRRLLLYPAVRKIAAAHPGIWSDVQAALPETRPTERPGSRP